MSDHPQAFWYDLVRRLGHGPDPRPLGREEAWAEYQDAPHAPPSGTRRRADGGATSALDSAVLFERARAGSDAAWRTLYERYPPMLVSQIRARFPRLAQRPVDAEDALQAAMVRVHMALRRFEYRGKNSFRRWLAALVVHELARDARAEGAARRNEPSRTTHLTGDARSVLLATLGELEEEDRDILLMRHLESLSFRDIADVLQCPSDLARRRYARALSRLTEHMAHARPQGREELLGTGEHELRRHASDTRPHGPSTQEER